MANEDSAEALLEHLDAFQAREHEFVKPTRGIFNYADLQNFHTSPTYKELILFVRLLNQSVKGKAASDSLHASDAVKAAEGLLDELYTWVDEIPPLPGFQGRFGNKAFRTYHARLGERAAEMIGRVLPEEKRNAVVELIPYWTDAFGNATRIDYGSGHEASFAIWMFGLAKLGVFKPEDYPALVLKIFAKYLWVMRRLQLDYMLEPAGSHGVWGLDDYQVLVFYWGAGQLVDHPTFKPTSIHDDTTLKLNREDYLYFGAIAFIKEAKRGAPFAECSPMLNDISGVPSWTKVNSGMLKYFTNEVLGKLPVIQHLVFGTLFKCTWSPSRSSVDNPPSDNAGSGGDAGMLTKAPWASAVGSGSQFPAPPPGATTVAPWATGASAPGRAAPAPPLSGSWIKRTPADLQKE